MRSHFLKVKFRKHGTNTCKQKPSGAIFVRRDGAKSLKQIKDGTTLHARLVFRSRAYCAISGGRGGNFYFGDVHVEIRDLSQKTKSYDPSALVANHSIKNQ